MGQVSQGRSGHMHAVVFIQGHLGHCFLRSFQSPRGSSPPLTVSPQGVCPRFQPLVHSLYTSGPLKAEEPKDPMSGTPLLFQRIYFLGIFLHTAFSTEGALVGTQTCHMGQNSPNPPQDKSSVPSSVQCCIIIGTRFLLDPDQLSESEV